MCFKPKSENAQFVKRLDNQDKGKTSKYELLRMFRTVLSQTIEQSQEDVWFLILFTTIFVETPINRGNWRLVIPVYDFENGLIQQFVIIT